MNRIKNKSNFVHDASFEPLMFPRKFLGCKLAKIYESRDDSSNQAHPSIRSANSYLNRGLRDTRYIGRAEGMHRLDRPFMKASWDKTLEGVPTPEGDDVFASKLPIVSWEKGRGSCWKVTWLRWFVELHSIWIFLYYGLSLFSWIYLHIFNDTWSSILDSLWFIDQLLMIHGILYFFFFFDFYNDFKIERGSVL